MTALVEIGGWHTAMAVPVEHGDSCGGIALLRASRELWPFLAHCFADRAYWGERLCSATDCIVGIV